MFTLVLVLGLPLPFRLGRVVAGGWYTRWASPSSQGWAWRLRDFCCHQRTCVWCILLGGPDGAVEVSWEAILICFPGRILLLLKANGASEHFTKAE